jgi:hypothetical protein
MVTAGFSGTQNGMTVAQVKTFAWLLSKLGVKKFHHGDCIGSDHMAHILAKEQNLYVVVHPPIKHVKRAFVMDADEVHVPKGYLVRNRDIVNKTAVMIFTPREIDEQLRSGTWSTFRYAIECKRPIYLIQPDGVIKTYNVKGFTDDRTGSADTGEDAAPKAR